MFKSKSYFFNSLEFIAALVLLFLYSGFLSSVYAASVPIAEDPVISRNVPAYSSDDCFGTKLASLANDNDYKVYWRSCNATPSVGTPVTLTYDLSGVASANRKNVIVSWYNDPVTGAYNHTLISVNAYNMPGDYTIDANAAAGGGAPPGGGWVTLATVVGNVYHSRQHAVDLTGYNWVRLSATSSEGSILNTDIALNMDVHDVSSGVADDWIFFGDSITQQAFLHTSDYGGTFSQVINSFNASYFPIYESGGIGGFVSADGVSNINTWLGLFPGKFVTLNYGTNDANTNVAAATFFNNMKTMVDAIIAAGKIPVIPKIPWGCTANLTANVPTLNAKIDDLYSQYPQIIKGPDLYTFFNANQGDISGDCIHPTDPSGYTDYLSQWTSSMETAVYTVPTVSILPVAGNYSTTQSVTLTSSKTGTIYYTTDGSTPTTSSSVYSSAISVGSTKTVKAITVDQAGNQSDAASSTFTFPSSVSGSSSSSSSSSGPSYGPNNRKGWSKEIMAGPSYVGLAHFISGEGEAGEAKTFINENAPYDDLYVSINKVTPLQLLLDKSVVYPWSQGFNTVSEIYDFSAVSSFNGYPELSFKKPVTVVVPYDFKRLRGVSPANLSIAYFDKLTGRWKLLSKAIVDLQNHTLASVATKFSYFTVVYKASVFSNVLSAKVENNAVIEDGGPFKSLTVKTYILPRQVDNVRHSLEIAKPKKCVLMFCW